MEKKEVPRCYMKTLALVHTLFPTLMTVYASVKSRVYIFKLEIPAVLYDGQLKEDPMKYWFSMYMKC